METSEETVGDLLKLLRMLDDQAYVHHYKFRIGLPSKFTSYDEPRIKIVDVTIGEIADRIEAAHNRVVRAATAEVCEALSGLVDWLSDGIRRKESINRHWAKAMDVLAKARCGKIGGAA